MVPEIRSSLCAGVGKNISNLYLIFSHSKWLFAYPLLKSMSFVVLS